MQSARLSLHWYSGLVFLTADLDSEREEYDLTGAIPYETGSVWQDLHGSGLTVIVEGEAAEQQTCHSESVAEMPLLSLRTEDGWEAPGQAVSADAEAAAALTDPDGDLWIRQRTLRLDNPTSLESTSGETLSGRSVVTDPFTGDVFGYTELHPSDYYDASFVYPITDVVMVEGEAQALFEGAYQINDTERSHLLTWSVGEQPGGIAIDLGADYHNMFSVHPETNTAASFGWSQQGGVSGSSLVAFDMGTGAEPQTLLDWTDIYRPEVLEDMYVYWNFGGEHVGQDSTILCLTQRQTVAVEQSAVVCIPRDEDGALQPEQMWLFTNPGYTESVLPSDFSQRFPEAHVIVLTDPDALRLPLIDGPHAAVMTHDPQADTATLFLYVLVEVPSGEKKVSLDDPSTATLVIDLTSEGAGWTPSLRCIAEMETVERLYGGISVGEDLETGDIAWFSTYVSTGRRMTTFDAETCDQVSSLDGMFSATPSAPGKWARSIAIEETLPPAADSGLSLPLTTIALERLVEDL